MDKVIIAGVIALIIGGGGGFFAGKSSVDTQKGDKQLQDAVVMMKDQAKSIEQMSSMMKSGGTMCSKKLITFRHNINSTLELNLCIFLVSAAG
jgi:hypothetical protein